MVERNAEARRLSEEKAGTHRWSTWGPYVSERQWGTVREDCSPYGTAWDAFSHDVAEAAPTGGARTASPASPTSFSGSM